MSLFVMLTTLHKAIMAFSPFRVQPDYFRVINLKSLDGMSRNFVLHCTLLIFSLASPTRSLRSSNRRMRTLSASASAVLSANKKSSVTSGYQPETKIARKNSLPSQQHLITSNMFKVVDTTSPAPLPSSSASAAPTKFPSLAKTNSIQVGFSDETTFFQ